MIKKVKRLKKFVFFCVIIFIFTWLTGACNASTPLFADTEKTSFGTRIHFGYWNDNFGYERLLLGRDHQRGADDFVTSSFFVKGIYTRPNYDLSFDLYLNIVTDKEDSRRIDIFTYRVIREQKISPGSFRYGIGIISRGITEVNSYRTGITIWLKSDT